MKRIIQILPTIAHGDAVSNDALAIRKIIKSMGFDTAIYTETTRNINISPDDIIIYHMSTGTDINFSIDKFPCKKIMVYHNITPPEFFRPYSRELFALTNYGYRGLEYLKDKFDLCIADSGYNKSQLIEYGYNCPVEVAPVVVPFRSYEKTPDISVLNKYRDDMTNILFVGRIAPNKCHQDIIKTFYYYKMLNPDSRLILAGSSAGTEDYYTHLKNYIHDLRLKDVIFTGHVPFREILSYYNVADLFLCMSRHEGFCVPLLEAMFFNVPIVALNACAVPETLSGSGVLLPDSDPLYASAVMHNILSDNILRDNIIKSQRERLADFSCAKTSGKIKRIIERFVNGEYL